jgi:hypothetical protein
MLMDVARDLGLGGSSTKCAEGRLDHLRVGHPLPALPFVCYATASQAPTRVSRDKSELRCRLQGGGGGEVDDRYLRWTCAPSF